MAADNRINSSRSVYLFSLPLPPATRPAIIANYQLLIEHVQTQLDVTRATALLDQRSWIGAAQPCTLPVLSGDETEGKEQGLEHNDPLYGRSRYFQVFSSAGEGY